MGRAIDADKLCVDLMERWDIADKQKEELVRQVMADIVTPIVVSQPTIEPERKEGRWIYGEDGMLHCSECEHIPCNRIIVNGITVYNLIPIKEKMKYCPVCGTRMMG